MLSLFKIFAFIPLCIELLIIVFLLPNNAGELAWIIHVPIAIMLAFITGCIVTNKKQFQKAGIVVLIVLTVVLCITGYYDYIKWFSTVVGVLTFAYFMGIRAVINKLNDNEESPD